MKTKNQFNKQLLSVFVLIPLFLSGGFGPFFAEGSKLSTAVFYVQ